MNIFFWILQVLLALHTLMGAVWKFSNSEATVASLAVIPHFLWLGLAGLEILCSLALIAPAVKKSLGKLVPLAALVIAAEMLLFSALHFSSGIEDRSPITYWMVVAAVCAFLAYGRTKLKRI
jgi:hypothetical protein